MISCVCVCVCVCVCATYIRTFMHTYICTFVCIHTYIRIYVCIHTYDSYIHSYIRIGFCCNNITINLPVSTSINIERERHRERETFVFWDGTASSHPFSLGIDDSTLWYSVPSGSLHKFYIGGTSIISMNSMGLAIGPVTALYPLYVSQGAYTTTLTKRYINTNSNTISSVDDDSIR
jgi:hypothetical protein